MRRVAVCINPFPSLQAKFVALSTSAKQWTDSTGTTLRNAAAGHFGGGTDSPTASSTLKEIARGQSGALPGSSAPDSGKENQAAAEQKDAGLGHDQELEAYLHVSPASPYWCVGECQGAMVAALRCLSFHCCIDTVGFILSAYVPVWTLGSEGRHRAVQQCQS